MLQYIFYVLIGGMTRKSQKYIEIFYAEEASKALNKKWHVDCSKDELNWPDLIIETNEESFGLEVREIYLDEVKKGSLKKEKEALNSKILNNIANNYYNENMASISVNILGDLSNEKEILQSIVSNVQNLSEYEKVKVTPYRGCSVYITKVPDELKEYKRGWTYLDDRVGWVGSLKEDALEKVIDSKSKKIDKYKSNIADVRLLFVGNRRFNSGLFNYKGGNVIDKKGFNKVYFFSFPDSIEEF